MILYYDGSNWFTDNPVLPSGLEAGYLQSIWGSGASDIYAVGNGYDNDLTLDSPMLYHNDGSGWTEASPALPAGVDNGYLNTVWGSGANDVYAAGQGVTGFDQSLLLYHGVLSAPTVSTDSIETLEQRKVYATLSALGTPASVSAYGVVYNTTGTPTISDSKVDKGATTSTGAYTIGLGEMSLTAGTKYYVRAFATNATDTSYGAELVVYGTPGILHTSRLRIMQPMFPPPQPFPGTPAPAQGITSIVSNHYLRIAPDRTFPDRTGFRPAELLM
ncbi:MAG: hypothetical protein IPN96_23920 [Anaerolineales bacterium]|nr:hypothetical protein [Anaerolineales bacterium]